MTLFSKNKVFKEDFVYLKICVGDRDINLTMNVSFKEPRNKSAIPYAKRNTLLTSDNTSKVKRD